LKDQNPEMWGAAEELPIVTPKQRGKPLLWFVKGEYTGPWIGDVTRSDVNRARFEQNLAAWVVQFEATTRASDPLWSRTFDLQKRALNLRTRNIGQKAGT
jgi:hypothetical protein